MPTARTVASHTVAGRVETLRLAVRASEDTVAPAAAGAAGLEASGPLRAGDQRLAGVELRVAVEADADSASFDLRVSNPGPRPVFLHAVVLGFRWKRSGAGSLRFLRHGWQSWSATGARDLDAAGEPAFPSGPWLRGMHHAHGAPPSDRQGWHESHLALVVGTSPTGPACLVGVLERGRAFGVLYARRDGADVLIEAELVVEARLEPGEARPLERVRVALGVDASVLLEAFGDAHGRLAAARTARPFLAGWCSWYHFFHDVNEADVLRNLEALAAARPGLCLDVVQIDDGYQRAIGDWLETNAKFPARPRAARGGDPRGGLHGRPLDCALLRRAGELPVREARRLAAAQRRCFRFAGCCTRSGAATLPCTCSTRADRRCASTSQRPFVRCGRWASTT